VVTSASDEQSRMQVFHDKYGISGAVNWGGDASKAIAIWGTNNVWQALNVTGEELVYVYNQGIRRFWLEEPYHNSDDYKYVYQRQRMNDLVPSYNLEVYTADWSDKCKPDCFDCMNGYAALDQYLDGRGWSSFIKGKSSDKYWGGWCDNPLDHWDYVRQRWGADMNFFTWVNIDNNYTHARQYFYKAKELGFSIVCIYCAGNNYDYPDYEHSFYDAAAEMGFLHKWIYGWRVETWKIYREDTGWVENSGYTIRRWGLWQVY